MIRLSKQRGLAAVEATIALPILLLLMMAIGEFGRLLYEYNTLTKAVRSGVRTASVSSNPGNYDVSLVQEKTKNMILYGQEIEGTKTVLPGLKAEDINVSPVLIDGDTYVEIHVIYDWQPMFGDSFNTFFGNTILLSFPLETSMTMRALL